MTENLYRRLQQQLDQYALGFPPADSGVEIRILREMFTAEEADLFTSLTAELETPAAVAARLGLPVAEIAGRLEDMAGKGLLFRIRKGEAVEYSAIPFIHGLVEFQVNRLSRDTVRKVGEYIKERFGRSMSERIDSFLRTVPVGRAIDPTRFVAAFDDAREILKSQELIVVTDCACRKQTAMFGKACDKPLEVCFMFGPMGRYYIDNGLGREIGLDEALALLTKAQEAGLVTQPASAERPFTMCSCCGDCCGFLRTLNRHPKPAELVLSNYAAVIDRDLCTGCETCLGRCQTRAVKMEADGLAAIDPDRCIGCGLCATACPSEAIRLVPKPESQWRRPVRDTREQMVELARRRGLDAGDPAGIVSFGMEEKTGI